MSDLGNTSSKRGRKKVQVKTKKGRKTSSQRWLHRQLNDPYVAAAQREGYRSRAAYKLLEINEKFDLLNAGARVLDLGAAPGGWTQVATKVLGESGHIVAIDILEMEPLAGAITFQGDIYEEDAPDKLIKALDGKADLVMSDMAANTVGHPPTDHIRTIALAEAALDIAIMTLKPGGHFVAKVFQGGANQDLLTLLKDNFQSVKHFKPPASRKGSPETYVVAKGFKGDV